MRMVLDTNVLVSALITPGGLPDKLLQHWEADDFTLVTSSAQLDELLRVLAYDKLRSTAFLLPFSGRSRSAEWVSGVRSRQ